LTWQILTLTLREARINFYGTQIYRASIDVFLLLSSQRQKRILFSWRSLRLCGENGKEYNMILYDEKHTFDLRAFGIEIPLRDSRATRTFDHLKNHPLLGNRIDRWHVRPSGERANRTDLMRVHTKDYVDRLFSPALTDEIIRTFELIDSHGRFHRYNPANAAWPLAGLFDQIMEQVSGAIQCCRIALEKGFAFYFGGGAHHAQAGYGRGFCLLNDIVIAIRKTQVEQAAGPVWVIDVDAHKGDGTAALTWADPSIVTLSVHMGRGWPLDGDTYDGDGRLNDSFIASDIDIPVFPGEENQYVAGLSEGLARMEGYGLPELAVVVSGADPYEHDALPSTLEIRLTLDQMIQRDLLIYRFLKQRHIPRAYLMAGGYGERVWEVYARFLEWALLEEIK